MDHIWRYCQYQITLKGSEPGAVRQSKLGGHNRLVYRQPRPLCRQSQEGKAANRPQDQ